MRRIERRAGVLEDHLQIAAGGEEFAGGVGGEIAAIEDDGAAGGGHQLENRAREGGFAAAGFTDEAEDFAAAHGEIDAVDGFDGADVTLQEESLRDRKWVSTSVS